MTKPKPKSKQDDAEQSERFVKMAREAEASESEEEATRAFRKVVKGSKNNPKSKR